jgi:hypothetical protein
MFAFSRPDLNAPVSLTFWYPGVAHLLPGDTAEFTGRLDDPSRQKTQEPNARPDMHGGGSHGPLTNDLMPVTSGVIHSMSSEISPAQITSQPQRKKSEYTSFIT